MSKPNPVPALIVSGFLGAGKTTLVQHLLEQAQAEGVRLAIVSNEFGDTGIDRALLDAGEEGFVELDGGCVCCRLSDALSETLEALLTQVRPDRLVLSPGRRRRRPRALLPIPGRGHDCLRHRRR